MLKVSDDVDRYSMLGSVRRGISSASDADVTSRSRVLLCIAGGVAVLWFDGGKSPRPGGRALGAVAPRQAGGGGAGR
jgi:hypothetical protein